MIPGAFSVFNSFVFMSFFKNFPASLEESARVDGASTARIFYQIVIPTSKPVFASITLFTAVGQWNAWYDNMLYVKKPELTTLSFMFTKMIHSQMYLQEQMDSMGAAMGLETNVTSMSLQLATMVVAVVPIMVLYPFLQKYFAQGIMIGSIKG
ncbi:MAG TPA: ABC transporter permease subunit [Clostridia bacterium]|nr:ABC transporter permease subunit [Clostridia bacterium]